MSLNDSLKRDNRDNGRENFVLWLKRALSVLGAIAYFYLCGYLADNFLESVAFFFLGISLFSLPMGIFCIFLVKNRVFKRVFWCFASLFIIPFFVFLTVSAGAYVWNSYLGGDLFLAAWLYFNCLSLAVYTFLSGIVCGITLYIFFKSQKKGGDKND